MDNVIVQQFEVWVAGNYAIAASATLWIADYMGTLSMESRMIWRKKHTGTSILFILNRYSSFLYLLIYMVFRMPGNSTDQECRTLLWIFSSAEAMSLITTTALFSLRVYAIYDESQIILAISILFTLSRLAMDIVVHIHFL
ncbi:hypothetical protein GYMLUDRAFT_578997 [Collybiopsis luxurians FD-317 M1]|uniref:DUF6533 domain-containing protein n=1 Tax=Collybiopsis luxurians FD-317 M1 TaxID=944289 RepID=A0A0D0BWE5_9AGAR|nr:hypothetical protein GYMLUDRAFT_578997 [Collybiopsis luxurians FD-317 M1]